MWHESNQDVYSVGVTQLSLSRTALETSESHTLFRASFPFSMPVTHPGGVTGMEKSRFCQYPVKLWKLILKVSFI